MEKTWAEKLREGEGGEGIIYQGFFGRNLVLRADEVRIVTGLMGPVDSGPPTPSQGTLVKGRKITLESVLNQN